MCGITGYIDIKNKVDESTIQSMTDALIHRGPDDGSIFISSNNHFSLGHRRLSFVDLSEQGKQPMKDCSEQIIITFNGEIYNYLELKKELSDIYSFQTQTDTEVILAGYQKWGIQVVSKLKGMFAFGILDLKLNCLFLVRDRFGIKPLYYTIQDSKLVFASELKAIHAAKQLEMNIDFTSFVDYFVYRYVPSPKTIWKNIYKLAPANYAKIDLNSLEIHLTEYWKLNQNDISPHDELKDADRFKDSIQKTDELIKISVKEHIKADVPVGSFLSGGYDSSALVSYIKDLAYKPETFSIGFANWDKSEDQFAQKVADFLKVSNESIVVDETSLHYVDRMADVYDEPIADISIVPTYLVSELARTKVKAVVSGEGADEIFGGYTWQHDFYKQNNPRSFLDAFKKMFHQRDTVQFYANAMAMGGFDQGELKKMLHPRLHIFIPDDVHWFYRNQFNSKLSPLKSIQYMDLKCFMAELVLTKVDRASMANSLEVRVPFLDHELVEYVFGLDEKLSYDENQTKYLLFKNIEHRLPDEILKRKKQGFVGPDSYYMQVEWYKKQFEKSKLVELKIINPTYLESLLEESYSWKLWKLLIMEKWVQKWI